MPKLGRQPGSKTDEERGKEKTECKVKQTAQKVAGLAADAQRKQRAHLARLAFSKDPDILQLPLTSPPPILIGGELLPAFFIGSKLSPKSVL